MNTTITKEAVAIIREELGAGVEEEALYRELVEQEIQENPDLNSVQIAEMIIRISRI